MALFPVSFSCETTASVLQFLEDRSIVQGSPLASSDTQPSESDEAGSVSAGNASNGADRAGSASAASPNAPANAPKAATRVLTEQMVAAREWSAWHAAQHVLGVPVTAARVDAIRKELARARAFNQSLHEGRAEIEVRRFGREGEVVPLAVGNRFSAVAFRDGTHDYRLLVRLHGEGSRWLDRCWIRAPTCASIDGNTLCVGTAVGVYVFALPRCQLLGFVPSDPVYLVSHVDLEDERAERNGYRNGYVGVAYATRAEPSAPGEAGEADGRWAVVFRHLTKSETLKKHEVKALLTGAGPRTMGSWTNVNIKADLGDAAPEKDAAAAAENAKNASAATESSSTANEDTTGPGGRPSSLSVFRRVWVHERQFQPTCACSVAVGYTDRAVSVFDVETQRIARGGASLDLFWGRSERSMCVFPREYKDTYGHDRVIDGRAAVDVLRVEGQRVLAAYDGGISVFDGGQRQCATVDARRPATVGLAEQGSLFAVHGVDNTVRLTAMGSWRDVQVGIGLDEAKKLKLPRAKRAYPSIAFADRGAKLVVMFPDATVAVFREKVDKKKEGDG